MDLKFTFVFACIFSHFRASLCDIEANKVVIGILSVDSNRVKNLTGEYSSDTEIHETYVKTILNTTARVVPLKHTLNTSELESIIGKVNGVLFIGGSQNGDYKTMMRKIYDLAKAANDAGTHFPLWGTCLGFHHLVMKAARPYKTSMLSRCNIGPQSTPLEITTAGQISRLFSNMNSTLKAAMTSQNLSYHIHNYCIRSTRLVGSPPIDGNCPYGPCYSSEEGRLKKLRITAMATAINSEGAEETFVSAVEHTDYPFYGIQTHPEKNAFARSSSVSMDYLKTADGIAVGQYFAEFLVNEARKNNRAFDSQELAQLSIDNYTPVKGSDLKPMSDSFAGSEYYYLF